MQTIDNDPRHQEAGEDEKHIYPDKATLYARHPEVVEHHGDYGPGPKAVDVWSEILADVIRCSAHGRLSFMDAGFGKGRHFVTLDALFDFIINIET